MAEDNHEQPPQQDPESTTRGFASKCKESARTLVGTAAGMTIGYGLLRAAGVDMGFIHYPQAVIPFATSGVTALEAAASRRRNRNNE
ncbi:MAG TPA: hypothetical protein VLG67_01335 [Candidatus Saccharimonadales bacterium]|nr:hypothetical protein [Candidatus Saccharimonadales bacterium]